VNARPVGKCFGYEERFLPRETLGECIACNAYKPFGLAFDLLAWLGSEGNSSVGVLKRRLCNGTLHFKRRVMRAAEDLRLMVLRNILLNLDRSGPVKFGALNDFLLSASDGSC
jgi:hypothetical protein